MDAPPRSLSRATGRSRFNRRRRQLGGVINAVRRQLLARLDLAADGQCVLDSAPAPAHLRDANRLDLRALPRRNQRQQPAEAVRHLLNRARQVAETVNSQLAEQFKVEVNYAQSVWGLTARLATKLTAHVACVFLNRQAGRPNVLHLKTLAFPPPN